MVTPKRFTLSIENRNLFVLTQYSIPQRMKKQKQKTITTKQNIHLLTRANSLGFLVIFLDISGVLALKLQETNRRYNDKFEMQQKTARFYLRTNKRNYSRILIFDEIIDLDRLCRKPGKKRSACAGTDDDSKGVAVRSC